MNFDRFETRARQMWEEVPAEFLEGIDGLVISAETEAHPDHADVYTLGECITEAYPSDWQGPDTLRSLLVLYYGSFDAVARGRAEFDWDAELWETITHELRHHLESLAAEDTLEGVDYGLDHERRRYAGESFDPYFFRAGESRTDGLYQLEGSWYVEIPLPPEPTPTVQFDWEDSTWELPIPDANADVIFVDVFFPDPDIERERGLLTIVFTRSQSWTRTLGGLVKGRKTTVAEYEVEVVLI